MAFRIQLRNDTLANWSSTNPILLQGEPAFENDTNRLKIGNGSSVYTALPYFYGNIESVNGLSGLVEIIGGTGISVTTDGNIEVFSNRPYKIYTVNLNSTGSNSPTAILLESDFTASVNWTRGGTGSYIATLSGATGSAGDFGHSYNKVFINPISSATGAHLTGQYLSPSEIAITQVDLTGNILDGLTNAFVDIKVYN